MSDVDLTVYPALRSGRVVTDLATTINSANTYYFRNNGKMLLHVNNTIDGLAITDKIATLATAKGRGVWAVSAWRVQQWRWRAQGHVHAECDGHGHSGVIWQR